MQNEHIYLNTLEEFFHAYLNNEETSNISNRTINRLLQIQNRVKDKYFVVFDNAGGCAFDIIEVSGKKEINSTIDFLNEKYSGEIIIGHYINGISFLAENQKTRPHSCVIKYLRKKEVEELNIEYQGKRVKYGLYIDRNTYGKVIKIDENLSFHIEPEDKKYGDVVKVQKYAVEL